MRLEHFLQIRSPDPRGKGQPVLPEAIELILDVYHFNKLDGKMHVYTFRHYFINFSNQSLMSCQIFRIGVDKINMCAHIGITIGYITYYIIIFNNQKTKINTRVNFA